MPRGVLQLKMCFLGLANTGKTSLSLRIRGHQGPLPATRPTIFQDTSSVHYEGDEDLEDDDFPRVVVNLFDSSGQEKIALSNVARQVYRSSHIVWLVFSVDDLKSLEKIGVWHEKVKTEVDDDCVFVLVGNKCDVEDEERQISTSEAAMFAQERGFPFFETSARDTTNVQSTFQFSVREVVKMMRANGTFSQRTAANSSTSRSASGNNRKGPVRAANPRANAGDDKKESGGCC